MSQPACGMEGKEKLILRYLNDSLGRGRMDGWMDGWTDGRTDGRINGQTER